MASSSAPSAPRPGSSSTAMAPVATNLNALSGSKRRRIVFQIQKQPSFKKLKSSGSYLVQGTPPQSHSQSSSSRKMSENVPSLQPTSSTVNSGVRFPSVQVSRLNRLQQQKKTFQQQQIQALQGLTRRRSGSVSHGGSAGKLRKHPSDPASEIIPMEPSLPPSKIQKVLDIKAKSWRKTEQDLLTDYEVNSFLKLAPTLSADAINAMRLKSPFFSSLKIEEQRSSDPREEKEISKVRFRKSPASSSLLLNPEYKQEYKLSLSIWLFQAGFSFNGKNFRPYDSIALQFLEAIDEGYIPLSLYDGYENSINRFHYYDGSIFAEIQDYRFATASDPLPTRHLIILKVGSDVVSCDMDSLAEKIVKESSSNRSVDDLRIELEKHILRAKQPAVCLDSGIAVSQISSLLNYEKMKPFARSVDSAEVYSSSLLKLPGSLVGSLRRGISTASEKLRKEFENGYSKMWDEENEFERLGNLLKFAHSDIAHRSAKTAAKQNLILSEPLFRNTVFNRNPALQNQSHMSSLLFVHKAMQPGTAVQNRDPRLTIHSSVKPKPPSQRRVPTQQPHPSAVQILRFLQSARPNVGQQLHDLYVFSKYAKATQANPIPSNVPQEPVRGVYEGVIKITSEGGKALDMLRFPIGNKEATERFIKSFEKQSEREGRKLAHQNENALAARNKEEKMPSNFISIDPSETQKQRDAASAAQKAAIPPVQRTGSSQRMGPVPPQSGVQGVPGPPGVPQTAQVLPPTTAPAQPLSQGIPPQIASQAPVPALQSHQMLPQHYSSGGNAHQFASRMVASAQQPPTQALSAGRYSQGSMPEVLASGMGMQSSAQSLPASMAIAQTPTPGSSRLPQLSQMTQMVNANPAQTLPALTAPVGSSGLPANLSLSLSQQAANQNSAGAGGISLAGRFNQDALRSLLNSGD